MLPLHAVTFDYVSSPNLEADPMGNYCGLEIVGPVLDAPLFHSMPFNPSLSSAEFAAISSLAYSTVRDCSWTASVALPAVGTLEPLLLNDLVIIPLLVLLIIFEDRAEKLLDLI